MNDSFLKKSLKLLVIWIVTNLLFAPAALLTLFIIDYFPRLEEYSFLFFILVFIFFSAAIAYLWIKETRGGKILYALISAGLFIVPRIGLLMFGLA